MTQQAVFRVAGATTRMRACGREHAGVCATEVEQLRADLGNDPATVPAQFRATQATTRDRPFVTTPAPAPKSRRRAVDQPTAAERAERKRIIARHKAAAKRRAAANRRKNNQRAADFRAAAKVPSAYGPDLAKLRAAYGRDTRADFDLAVARGRHTAACRERQEAYAKELSVERRMTQ